jgi:hypothetical protein
MLKLCSGYTNKEKVIRVNAAVDTELKTDAATLPVDYMVPHPKRQQSAHTHTHIYIYIYIYHGGNLLSLQYGTVLPGKSLSFRLCCHLKSKKKKKPMTYMSVLPFKYFMKSVHHHILQNNKKEKPRALWTWSGPKIQHFINFVIL